MTRADAETPNVLLTIAKVAVLFLLLALESSMFSEAQQTRALPIESALNTHSLAEASPISFSPDGKWLAYMARDNRREQAKKDRGIERDHYVRTGLFLRNEGGDIWISNTETNESRNLTEGKGSNWDPAWSPDGRFLAFLSDRDGSGQARLWIWDSSKNILRMLATTNVRSSYPSPGIQWTRDSRRLLITIVPQRLGLSEYVNRVLSPLSTEKRFMEPTRGSTVVVYEGSPIPPNDVAATRASRYNLDAYALADLVSIEVESGKVTEIAAGHRVGWYAGSPDGLHVAYTIPKRLAAEGRFRKVFDLVSVNLATGGEQILASDAVTSDVFTWSPDSSFLIYGVYEGQGTTFFAVAASGGQARTIAKLSQAVGSFEMPVWDRAAKSFYLLVDGGLWCISVSGATPRQVAKIPGQRIVRRVSDANGTLWSADGGRSTVVLVRDDAGKQYVFYKIDLATGESKKMLEDGRCFECDVLGSGLGLGMVAAVGSYVAFSSQNAQHAPDLWLSDFEFHKTHQLTHLNPQLDCYEMGAPRLLDWLSDDGEQLHGALLLPSGYQAGVRYPLLVYVYSAPLSNELDKFALGEFPGPLDLQLFATRGYAVLLPDVKGERAYGMTVLGKSVLPGINRVVEMGVADPERIGLMGHSQGGYATMALIVQTDRFKAALDVSGFSDFAGLYGQLEADGVALPSDEVERLSVGALPWQDSFRYVWSSPFYSLDRARTPLLIVHGSKDEAVSSALSDQLFVGMRRLGREVEYAKYEGESHVPRDWSYENQVDLCVRVLRWFDVHLKADADRNASR